MPTFDVEKEVINTFEIEEKYCFTEYFDQNELFDQLEEYYNSDKYRFEVNEGDITKVSKILDNYFYRMDTKENLENFCVIQHRTEDASEILRNAVAVQYHRNYEIYLMKDDKSVRQAVENGATPIKKSEVNVEDIEWKSG